MGRGFGKTLCIDLLGKPYGEMFWENPLDSSYGPRIMDIHFSYSLGLSYSTQSNSYLLYTFLAANFRILKVTI